MLNLLLTRHGFTTAGEIVLGGVLDVPLAQQGRDEAAALRDRLAGFRIDRVISSPMIRAVDTARIVAPGRPIETEERLREMHYGRWEGLTFAEIPARDPELRARWESDPAETHTPGGESGDEVASRVLSFLMDLLESEGISGSLATADDGAAASGTGKAAAGPTPRPVGQARFSGAAGMPPRSGPDSGTGPDTGPLSPSDRNVLVVAHGTTNRILLSLGLGAPMRDFRRRWVQDRGNLTVLRYDRGDLADGAQLALLNDTSHLRGLGEARWD